MKAKDTVKKMGMTEAIQTIKSAKTIALFCHINPDCDTICSALALKLSLDKLGKTVHVFCDGEMKNGVNRVFKSELVNRDKSIDRYDLCAAIDCGDRNRVGSYYSLFKNGFTTLCIDHHKQTDNFAKVNYVESFAGATAELIYSLIVKIDASLIDSHIATLLYTALVTDTGNFSFSNTGERTLRIASELLRFGVNNSDISYVFYKEIRLPVFKLKARAIGKAQFFENDKIGVITFEKEDFEATGTTSADSSNIVNELINISGVEIAVSITEVKPHSYKLSVRTGKKADASKIAGAFGGGGHKNAAGFMMNGFLGNVIDDVLKVCKDNL